MVVSRSKFLELVIINVCKADTGLITATNVLKYLLLLIAKISSDIASSHLDSSEIVNSKL